MESRSEGRRNRRNPVIALSKYTATTVFIIRLSLLKDVHGVVDLVWNSRNNHIPHQTSSTRCQMCWWEVEVKSETSRFFFCTRSVLIRQQTLIYLFFYIYYFSLSLKLSATQQMSECCLNRYEWKWIPQVNILNFDSGPSRGRNERVHLGVTLTSRLISWRTATDVGMNADPIYSQWRQQPGAVWVIVGYFVCVWCKRLNVGLLVWRDVKLSNPSGTGVRVGLCFWFSPVKLALQL